MGNITEGKTYVKGSHKTIQPRVAGQIDMYKTKKDISSSSNINSQISFTTKPRLQIKTYRKLAEDITNINQQNYDHLKYQSQVHLGQP